MNKRNTNIIFVTIFVVIGVIAIIVWGVLRSDGRDLGGRVVDSQHEGAHKVSSPTPTPPVKLPTTDTSQNIPKVAESPLQARPYVDTSIGFSIRLPKNWVSRAVESAAEGIKVSFHDKADTKETPDFLMMIGKSVFGEEEKEAIATVGEDAFVNILIEDFKSRFNQYTVQSTKKVSINNHVYYQIAATYIGEETSIEVTHYAYISFSEKTIYLVVLEAYTKDFGRYKDVAFKSIETLKLGP